RDGVVVARRAISARDLELLHESDCHAGLLGRGFRGSYDERGEADRNYRPSPTETFRRKDTCGEGRLPVQQPPLAPSRCSRGSSYGASCTCAALPLQLSVAPTGMGGLGMSAEVTVNVIPCECP